MNKTTEHIEQVKLSLSNLEQYSCELEQRAKDLNSQATKAIQNYLDDFKQRKDAIKLKISNLESKITQISKSILTLYAGISEKAMSDNFDALKSAQEEVKKLEILKSQLQFQLKAIKNGLIKGDTELLAIAKNKYEEYLSADADLRESIEQLCHFTYEYEEEIEYLRHRRQYVKSGFPPKIELVDAAVCIGVDEMLKEDA